MKQQEFAEIVGLALPTIQSIEVKRLRLSPRLAKRIADATGANELWLLGSRASRLPIDKNFEPYVRETYLSYVVEHRVPQVSRGPQLDFLTHEYCRWLIRIFASACRRKTAEICAAEVEDSFRRLEQIFGAIDLDEAENSSLAVQFSTGGKLVSPASMYFGNPQRKKQK